MEEIHNPGGKVRIKVEEGVVSSAVFSECGKYRYRLIRRWERLGQMVLFVMQMPSVADIENNDPTVAKCCRYAKRWGYSGVMIGNVDPFRSTDNKNMKHDQFSNENVNHVVEMAKISHLVVLASGKPPAGLSHAYGSFYDSFFHGLPIEHLGKLSYLKINKDFSFRHPLYLKEDLTPMPLVEPATTQDATPEFWDSLSTGGLPVEPQAFVDPEEPFWSKFATAELAVAIEDSLKNFSTDLDK